MNANGYLRLHRIVDNMGGYCIAAGTSGLVGAFTAWRVGAQLRDRVQPGADRYLVDHVTHDVVWGSLLAAIVATVLLLVCSVIRGYSWAAYEDKRVKVTRLGPFSGFVEAMEQVAKAVNPDDKPRRSQ